MKIRTVITSLLSISLLLSLPSCTPAGPDTREPPKQEIEEPDTEDGPYHKIWLALQADSELTAIVRSRQLHIYRNGKKALILAGKAAPKILMDDKITELF